MILKLFIEYSTFLYIKKIKNHKKKFFFENWFKFRYQTWNVSTTDLARITPVFDFPERFLLNDFQFRILCLISLDSL